MKLYESIGGRKLFCAYLSVTIALVLAIFYTFVGEAPSYESVMGFVTAALGITAGTIAWEDRSKQGTPPPPTGTE